MLCQEENPGPSRIFCTLESDSQGISYTCDAGWRFPEFLAAHLPFRHGSLRSGRGPPDGASQERLGELNTMRCKVRMVAGSEEGQSLRVRRRKRMAARKTSGEPKPPALVTTGRLGHSPPSRRPQGTPASTSPLRSMPSAPNARHVATAMSPPD